MQLFWIVLLICMYTLYGQTPEEVKMAILRAENYYYLEGRQTNNNLEWLPNSAKIGTGFDTAAGSPICYSGECQMEGFRRPVFKLSFVKQSDGSCTSQMIPDHVQLDCQSSLQLSIKTESIATLQQLAESVKKGMDSSTNDVKFGDSLRYGYSNDIRTIADTIMEANSTVYFTRGVIIWGRLAIFAPFLNLSESFRYVITNMPCCNYTELLDEYIRKYIIGYYGFTYINELVLGGIVQQMIIVSGENQKMLQQAGVINNDEAGAKLAHAVFVASIGGNVKEEIDKTHLSTFRKFSRQTTVTVMGGIMDLKSIEEWSKTVSANPVIVKFRIASLLDLLTSDRFPSDRMIDRKREMINKVQERYVNNALVCHKNCSGNGDCVTGGYLGIGICKCYVGWTGSYCSIFRQIPKGMLIRIPRNGTCSSGFQLNEHRLGLYQYGSHLERFGYACTGLVMEPKIFETCSTNVDTLAFAPAEALCGFAYFDFTILCDKHDPRSGSCPGGYALYVWRSIGLYNVNVSTCVKTTNSQYDATGTLCGMHSTIDFGKVQQTSCGTFDLSGGKCPNGFTFYQTWIPEIVTGAWLRLCASSS